MKNNRSKMYALANMIVIIFTLTSCSQTTPVSTENYNRIINYAKAYNTAYEQYDSKLSDKDISYINFDNLDNMYLCEDASELYYDIMSSMNTTFEVCPLCPEISIFDNWYGRDKDGNHVAFLALSSNIDDDTTSAPYIAASGSTYIIPELKDMPEHLTEYMTLWFKLGYMSSKYSIDWGDYQNFESVALYSFLSDEYEANEAKFFEGDAEYEDLINTFGDTELLRTYYSQVENLVTEQDETAMQYIIDMYVPTHIIYDAKQYLSSGAEMTSKVDRSTYDRYKDFAYYTNVANASQNDIQNVSGPCKISKINTSNILYAETDTIIANNTNKAYIIYARTPDANWAENDTVWNVSMYLMPNSKVHTANIKTENSIVSECNEDIFDCTSGSLIQIKEIPDDQIKIRCAEPSFTIFADDIYGNTIVADYDGRIFFNNTEKIITIKRNEETKESGAISSDSKITVEKTYPITDFTVNPGEIVSLGKGEYTME